MATEKTANYTAEQTAAMVSAYTAEPTRQTVESLAEQFGKSTRSIIAKLSREGVYQKAEYVGKTGEKPIHRDTLADEIGELVGLSEGEVDSLTKANKGALLKLRDQLVILSAYFNAEETAT